MSQYLTDFVSIAAAQVQKASRHPLAMLEIIIASAPLEVLLLPVVLLGPATALGHPALGTGPGYGVGHGSRCQGVNEGRLLVELLEDVPLATSLDRTVPAIVPELLLAVGGGQTTGLTQGSWQSCFLPALVVLLPGGRHVPTGSAHLPLGGEYRHHSVLRDEVFTGD